MNKLHLICGSLYPEIYLTCNNCGTLHTLDEVNAFDKVAVK